MSMFYFFFFNDTATTEIYTLSLHDALPISPHPDPAPRPTLPLPRPTWSSCRGRGRGRAPRSPPPRVGRRPDRKSTRLNSSHQIISYAVFCLKKKKRQMRYESEQVYETILQY